MFLSSLNVKKNPGKLHKVFSEFVKGCIFKRFLKSSYCSGMKFKYRYVELILFLSYLDRFYGGLDISIPNCEIKLWTT